MLSSCSVVGFKSKLDLATCTKFSTLSHLKFESGSEWTCSVPFQNTFPFCSTPNINYIRAKKHHNKPVVILI